MSTPINYALSYIKRHIPPQILERFFGPQKYQQLRRDPFMPSNIDALIIEKVIYGIVSLDIDTIGSTEAVIPLRGLPIERIDNDKYMVHIPKRLTNGRTITSALAMVFYGMENIYPSIGATLAGGINSANTSCTNPLLYSASALGNSYKPMPTTQTSNVRIVDGHTLLVEDLMMPTQDSYLRCILSTDREFSTLSKHTWRHFGHLCMLATKMYIYNNHTLDIDMAELVGGQELGKFKEIVEGYADSAEIYVEYLEDTWRKIQYMADEPRYTRMLKGLVGRFK